MIVMIGVGSNSPDKSHQMELALEFLRSSLGNFRCSSVYSTPALNGVDADYLNAVASGSCDMTIDEVVSILKEYECRCGRKKGDKSVLIDLDLVIADGTVLRPRDMDREYFRLGYRELISTDHAPSDRILR